MQALPGGAMAAVFAAEADGRKSSVRSPRRCRSRAINGPEDTVISGTAESIDAALAVLGERGVTSQRLTVSHAFHSASMDPILDEFERIAGQVAFQAPAIPIVSNLTGDVAGPEIATAAYWRRHLREPVRFAAGVKTLAAQGCSVFLEAGPKPTLIGLAKKSVPADVRLVPSLKPPRGEWTQMLDSVASIYAAGAAIDWTAFDAPYSRAKVTAPRYPFQRERYWLDGTGLVKAEAGEEHRTASGSKARAPACAGGRLSHRLGRGEPRGGCAGCTCGRTGVDRRSRPRKVAQHVADALRARGDRCHVIADLEQLPKALKDEGGNGAPAGVLHFASLDASTSPGMTGVDLERAQLKSTGGVLQLVQALVEQGVAAPVHLITRGVHKVGDNAGGHPAVAQSAVWGSGGRSQSSILSCGAADRHRRRHRRRADRRGDRNRRRRDQLALRGGSRYAPRLTSAPVAEQTFAGCRPDASYLVTGGLGVIGLEIARWLAQNGARHLVLAGRTGVPIARAGTRSPRAAKTRARPPASARSKARRDRARRGGRHLRYRDTRRSSSASASLPPCAASHAAATMGAARLRAMTPAALGEVLKPKARGAWVLHRLTQETPLDFFVLFSSVSALLGTADLGHYGAANAALDAFAEHDVARADSGQHQLERVGEPARLGRAQGRVRAIGMRSLAIDPALEALGRIIAADASHAVVANVDWPTFKAR